MITIKIIENEKLSRYGESRYVIVNNETDEIVDDAQGYGYKSINRALNCFVYCHDNLDYNIIIDKNQIFEILGIYKN